MWLYKEIQAQFRKEGIRWVESKPEWVVGYYNPEAIDVYPEWVTISTYKTEEEAAARVSYLNGGLNPDIECILSDIRNGYLIR